MIIAAIRRAYNIPFKLKWRLSFKVTLIQVNKKCHQLSSLKAYAFSVFNLLFPCYRRIRPPFF